MSDLREIYQEVILDHYRKPRNFSHLDSATREAQGHNPLCGDRVSLYLTVKDGRVEDISFQGAGCAISTASASLMTEAIKGKTVAEALGLFHRFHKMMTGDNAAEDQHSEDTELGKLEALSGVRQIPIRVKCATLAWHTLKEALEGSTESGTVSTE